MTWRRRALSVIAALFAASAFNSEAFAQDDICAHIPDAAAHKQETQGWCVAYFWPANHAPLIGDDLYDYGGIIWLGKAANEDAALKSIKPATTTGTIPTSYGNAGFQWMEDPNSGDLGPPNSSEVKRGKRGLLSTSIQNFKPYLTWFTCGTYTVNARANPSKAIAFREILKELEQKLAATGECAAKGAAVAAVNAPASTDVNPGWRNFEGEEARRILEADKSGARYVVVLDRKWDAAQNCWIEERALAGGIRGSGATDVTVGLGNKRTVCVRDDGRGAVVSQDRLNDALRVIADAEKNLAQALARHAQLEKMIKDGRAGAWAYERDKDVQKYIDYYNDIIRVTKNGLAASAPEF